jgi:hypothetical protein
MSSRAPTAAVLLALLVAVPASVASGSAGAAAVQSGPARAQLLDCSTGREPSRRSAVFRGEMRQIADAAQMRMRLHLHERIGSTRVWRSVAGYGKPKWRYSRPDIQVLAYRESVLALKPATRYRMRIEFHWLDDAGEVRTKTSRRSPVCRQRGRLPNLAVRAVRARPGPTDGTYRYVVALRNDGVVASPRSEVSLSVDGAEVDVRRFGRLAPRERRRVRFVGPACDGEVTAQVDPTDAVREITERDNTVRSRCSDFAVAR